MIIISYCLKYYPISVNYTTEFRHQDQQLNIASSSQSINRRTDSITSRNYNYIIQSWIPVVTMVTKMFEDVNYGQFMHQC